MVAMHHFLIPLRIQMLMLVLMQQLGTLSCGITLSPAVLQVMDVLPPEQPLPYPCRSLLEPSPGRWEGLSPLICPQLSRCIPLL